MEERKVSVPNDVVRYMDVWTIILMLGASAIWVTLGGAVVYLTQRPHRASPTPRDP